MPNGVLTHGTGICTVRATYDQGAGHWRLQPEPAAALMAQVARFSTADLGELTGADPAEPGPAERVAAASGKVAASGRPRWMVRLAVAAASADAITLKTKR